MFPSNFLKNGVSLIFLFFLNINVSAQSSSAQIKHYVFDKFDYKAWHNGYPQSISWCRVNKITKDNGDIIIRVGVGDGWADSLWIWSDIALKPPLKDGYQGAINIDLERLIENSTFFLGKTRLLQNFEAVYYDEKNELLTMYDEKSEYPYYNLYTLKIDKNLEKRPKSLSIATINYAPGSVLEVYIDCIMEE